MKIKRQHWLIKIARLFLFTELSAAMLFVVIWRNYDIIKLHAWMYDFC